MLHHSGKLTIPHDDLFLFLQILNLVLFKSLQRQGDMSIPGYSCDGFWQGRYGNRCLSFLRRADLTFFLELICCHLFSTISIENLSSSCWIGGSSTPSDISGCAIDLVDGAQCKCKRKHLFVFYALLWTCWETDYFRLSCEIFWWMTIAKSQALEFIYPTHARDIEGVIGEGKRVSWGGELIKGEVHKREISKNMLLRSDFLTSLSSSLTQLCFTIRNFLLIGNGVKR